MTPTVNTSPLAALLTDSTPTQSGAISSLAAAPGAAQGENQAGGESKFFNILQLVSVESSSEDALIPLSGAPWMGQAQPPGMQASGFQVPGQALATSEFPLALTDSGSGPGSGQAQHLSSAVLQKKQLLANAEFLSKKETSLEQGLTAGTLPALSMPALPLAPSVSSGSQLPPGGNGLPGSATPVQLMHRSMFDSAAQAPGSPLGSVGAANEGLSALSLQRELPAPVLAPAHFDRMPVPEFAAPLAKMLGGGPNVLTTGPASVDVSAILSEGETNQAELTRSAASISSLDKPSAVQQATTTLTLPRPAGAPGWDQGLGQRILWMVDNGLNQAELRLDPPNLGSVTIRISMHDDQAQLQFQAANPAAREALESALPKLREMFNQEGLELGDADVSDQQSQSDGDRESGELGAQMDADSQADTETSPDDWSPVELGRTSMSGGVGSNVLIDEFV